MTMVQIALGKLAWYFSSILVAWLVISMCLVSCKQTTDNSRLTKLSNEQLDIVEKNVVFNELYGLEEFDNSYPDSWPKTINIPPSCYLTNGSLKLEFNASGDGKVAEISGLMHGTVSDCMNIFLEENDPNDFIIINEYPIPRASLHWKNDNGLCAPNGSSFSGLAIIFTDSSTIAESKSENHKMREWCKFRIRIVRD